MGHKRRADYAIAVTEDKLPQPKAATKATQNTLCVTQTMHIYVVQIKPVEEVGPL